MLTRRGFLKGLLSSAAAGALIKNGVVQPEQVLAEAKPWTIDMAANTWRSKKCYGLYAGLGVPFVNGVATLRPPWEMPPLHVNCLCTLPMPLQASQELIDDAGGAWEWSGAVCFEAVDDQFNKRAKRFLMTGDNYMWRVAL